MNPSLSHTGLSWLFVIATVFTFNKITQNEYKMEKAAVAIISSGAGRGERCLCGGAGVFEEVLSSDRICSAHATSSPEPFLGCVVEFWAEERGVEGPTAAQVEVEEEHFLTCPLNRALCRCCS